MKRTQFNEPRPETEEEILEILIEKGVDAGDISATIDDEDNWDPESTNDAGINMTGSTAVVVVLNDGDGEEIFTTNGFETRAALVELLTKVGIDIND